jgi:hypothetical protein
MIYLLGRSKTQAMSDYDRKKYQYDQPKNHTDLLIDVAIKFLARAT